MPDPTPENVVALPASTTVVPAVTISSVTIDRIVDLPGQRIVRAFVKELPRPLVLWQGDTYDAIGDWTQSEANAKIVSLVTGS